MTVVAGKGRPRATNGANRGYARMHIVPVGSSRSACGRNVHALWVLETYPTVADVPDLCRQCEFWVEDNTRMWPKKESQ